MASTIAAMSTANDSSSTGRVPMNASPSRTDRSPAVAVRSSGARAGSRAAAYSATVNRTASTAYAAANDHRASTTPASSGPTTIPVVIAVNCNVFAAGTDDVGTIRGITAPHVDDDTAYAPAWTATSVSMTARLRRP